MTVFGGSPLLPRVGTPTRNARRRTKKIPTKQVWQAGRPPIWGTKTSQARQHTSRDGRPRRRTTILFLLAAYLNRGRVARPQNGKELIIGDEEKPGESVSLRVQVVGERFLGGVQSLAEIFQSFEAIFGRTGLHNIGILVGLGADLRRSKWQRRPKISSSDQSSNGISIQARDRNYSKDRGWPVAISRAH